MIADETQHWATAGPEQISSREIVRRSLELGATAIIVVHRRIDKSHAPSNVDIEMAKQLVLALSSVDITLHDYVLVGKNGQQSLKALGLLS